MRAVNLCLVLLGLAAAVAGCAPVGSAADRPATLPTIPTEIAQDLRVLPDDDPVDTQRLEQSGLGFTLANPSQIKPRITKADAIAKARPDLPHSVVGRITAAADLGYLTSAGATVSGVTPGRLIWFVGFTGPAIRVDSSGPPEAPRHIGHEDVVIIDAMTGEVVMSMTCCVIHQEGVLPPETCIQPAGQGPPFSCGEALQRAAKAAGQSQPEMGIQEARIDSLTAELMTYAAAHRRLASQHGYRPTPGQDPNQLVWLVTVVGSFRYEGMALAGSPEHPTYEAKERDYLFSAQTGQEIEEITPGSKLVGAGTPPAWSSLPTATP